MKPMNLCVYVCSTMLSLMACSKGGDKAGTTPPPVQTDTAKTPYQSLNLLYNISGKQTLSGIHNREPNSTPAVWTEKINSVTGKYPALWSGDFLFQEDNINNRQLMIDEAVRQWNKGAVINIMWHACNPALDEPCGWDDGTGVLSTLTAEQWTQLTTDGTDLNKKWKSRVDEVCTYLQQLKDKGVEVLWRPMHEMNQGKFWWAGRPGANGTIKLYQLMHDYMVKTKGLTNLIWVWDVQDFGSLSSDIVDYNPGATYFDVAALDVYDGSGYTQTKYELMTKAAAGKPFAIGECQRLPTATELRSQPKWCFFMSWSELTFDNNSNTEIQALYNASNVLTLDKLSGWKK